MAFESSELVLNPDGSLYHIALTSEHIHDNVIVVGDPGRVDLIASMMDSVENTIHNREFYTKIGRYNGQYLTVMSTGIGTDNIDIAINELDAAVNIDITSRQLKAERRSLNIVRLGTSGALQEDVPVDTSVVSKFGLGLDGLLNFYDVDYTKAKYLPRTLRLEQLMGLYRPTNELWTNVAGLGSMEQTTPCFSVTRSMM